MWVVILELKCKIFSSLKAVCGVFFLFWFWLFVCVCCGGGGVVIDLIVKYFFFLNCSLFLKNSVTFFVMCLRTTSPIVIFKSK